MRWKRLTIDVLFGITLPVLCLIGDPLIFQGTGTAEEPVSTSWIFDRYQVLFYSWILVCMAAFLYIHLRRSSGPMQCFFAGTLVAGAALAAFIGVAILPVSIPGLFHVNLSFPGLIVIAVAAIGFVPFMTAFVYVRQAGPMLQAALRWRGAGALVATGSFAPIALAGGLQLLVAAGLFA